MTLNVKTNPVGGREAALGRRLKQKARLAGTMQHGSRRQIQTTFLNYRSPLRGYYYVKGQRRRGMAGGAESAICGMRWNWYLRNGKTTPLFKLQHQELPVSGRMEDAAKSKRQDSTSANDNGKMRATEGIAVMPISAGLTNVTSKMMQTEEVITRPTGLTEVTGKMSIQTEGIVTIPDSAELSVTKLSGTMNLQADVAITRPIPAGVTNGTGAQEQEARGAWHPEERPSLLKSVVQFELPRPPQSRVRTSSPTLHFQALHLHSARKEKDSWHPIDGRHRGERSHAIESMPASGKRTVHANAIESSRANHHVTETSHTNQAGYAIESRPEGKAKAIGATLIVETKAPVGVIAALAVSDVPSPTAAETVVTRQPAQEITTTAQRQETGDQIHISRKESAARRASDSSIESARKRMFMLKTATAAAGLPE